MKTQYDIEEIKERLTYYVLNSLHNDPDPSDQKLKQMISPAITEQTSSIGMYLDSYRTADGGSDHYRDNGQRPGTGVL